MLRVTKHYVVSCTSHCHCMVSIIRHSGITGDCRSYVNIHDSTCPLRNGALSIGIYKLMLRIGILVGVCLRLYMHHQGDQEMNRHKPVTPNKREPTTGWRHQMPRRQQHDRHTHKRNKLPTAPPCRLLFRHVCAGPVYGKACAFGPAIILSIRDTRRTQQSEH